MDFFLKTAWYCAVRQWSVSFELKYLEKRVEETYVFVGGFGSRSRPGGQSLFASQGFFTFTRQPDFAFDRRLLQHPTSNAVINTFNNEGDFFISFYTMNSIASPPGGTRDICMDNKVKRREVEFVFVIIRHSNPTVDISVSVFGQLGCISTLNCQKWSSTCKVSSYPTRVLLGPEWKYFDRRVNPEGWNFLFEFEWSRKYRLSGIHLQFNWNDHPGVAVEDWSIRIEIRGLDLNRDDCW